MSRATALERIEKLRVQLEEAEAKAAEVEAKKEAVEAEKVAKKRDKLKTRISNRNKHVVRPDQGQRGGPEGTRLVARGAGYSSARLRRGRAG